AGTGLGWELGIAIADNESCPHVSPSQLVPAVLEVHRQAARPHADRPATGRVDRLRQCRSAFGRARRGRGAPPPRIADDERARVTERDAVNLARDVDEIAVAIE